jgi:hypothetical protein
MCVVFANRASGKRRAAPHEKGVAGDRESPLAFEPCDYFTYNNRELHVRFLKRLSFLNPLGMKVKGTTGARGGADALRRPE